jgi:tRNA pseudouridine13 synthase
VTEIMEPRTDRVEEAQFDTGKHAFVTVRRKGLSTPQMQRALAEVFGVRPDEIGYAGLKDMRAIATQTFSLPRDRLLPPELRQPDALDAIAGCLRADRRFELVEAGDTGEASVAHDCAPAWHMCKLRIGELSGNRFDIIVSDTCVPPRVALERATLIAERLRRTGWANYYGPQRFGKAGVEHSVRRGVELLRNRMGTARKSDANAHRGWIGTLMLNALQSALFNAYLAERMRRGLFETVLVGDLVAPPHSASAAAKPRMVRSGAAEGAAAAEATAEAAAEVEPVVGKDGEGQSGGRRHEAKSEAPRAEAETAALRRFELSFAGPMFSAAMPKAGGAAAALEMEIWSRYVPEVPLQSVKGSILRGGRRVCRMPVPADLRIEEAPAAAGLRFQFSLPRGSYATSLLREFMHCDDAGALGGAEDEGEEQQQEQEEEGGAGRVSELPGGVPGGDPDAAGAAASFATAHPLGGGPMRGLRVTSDPPHLERQALRQLATHLRQRLARPQEARAAAVQREDDGAEAVDGLVAADGAVATKIAATGTGPLSSVRRKRFTVSTLAAGRFPLVCFADDDPDPLSVALELLDDAAASADAMPSVARLVPVQGTCAATVEGIAEALTPLLARSVPEGATSFAVHWKTRRRSGCPPLSLDRSAAISAILTCVAEQVAGATVDLGAPDVTIHVEVLQEADMCCLSVLPQWAQRAEYSLRKEVDVGEGAASA